MQSKTSQLLQRTDGIAREAERRVITGVPTSSWYALQEKGLAPKPVRLGPHSVGWPRQELFAWCEQRLIERGDTWQSLGDAAARVVEKAREHDSDRKRGESTRAG
jgi:predicted DNA-binding transcriptional regulator AlpA